MNSTSDLAGRAEALRLADQLRRAVEGASWTGPNLTKVLDGITPGEALARPVATAHSIAEIVAHIAVWMEIPVRLLAGEAYDPPPAEDWPAVPDAAAWAATRARLDAGYRALLAALDALTDANLGETTPGKAYTHFVLLHGVVQHALWHGGQVILLKRALGNLT